MTFTNLFLVFLLTFAGESINCTVISYLTIYRASAGSGKTYMLSKEYIKLLLTSPGYHRRILAVTFTNKATEEMKSRVVSKLHDMANRRDEQYIREIAQELTLNETDLPVMAETVLAHLLHDYSYFSVVTIDSFFQRVIRAFAREMGLYAGYDVELDQDSVLDESIDLMLDNIDKNDFLRDWLVEWAKRKIEEGKSWNFKSDVQRLGSEIFSEELQNIEPDLLRKTTDKEALKRFRVKLQQLVNDYLDYLQDHGQMALSVMENYGLDVDSFKQKGRGVGGYFRKLSERQEADVNTYVQAALEDLDGWYGKDSPKKNAIRNAYEGGLREILHNVTAYQAEHAREITTTAVILKQINVLGVLCDLMDYVKNYTRDQNLFLLSEASGFLKTIIANADTPFIYERVGSFYNHFMIDEFQDTSSIQWENFRPLIADSLASGYPDWIVGDVKQSIYRWRNTDWKILSEKVENDLKSQKVQVQNLNRNWRSAPEIIQFNNAFFREAVLQICTAFQNDEQDAANEEYLHNMADELTGAYGDCYQHSTEPRTPNPNSGYVFLEMIPKEENTEKTWQDKVLEELPRRIEKLQDLGYGLSDIAILVRENGEAQIVADSLMAYRQAHSGSKYRYDVLSNESLLIDNSPVVKWLVAAMRYIVEPDNLINRAYLQHEFLKFKDSNPEFNSEQGFEGSMIRLFGSSVLQLRSLPVYELSDKLIRQFNLYQNEGQASFLQAFQDILLQYTRREATDIRSFLDWWDGEKHKKCVAMPDNQEAIRLITIHKSKGLEFDAVMIPFCDWQLCKSGKTLWCQPYGEPFNDMKLLPLKFEQALRRTVFVKDYLREKMMSYIDNLNLLYVAFTRARKALFVSTPQQEKDGFADVKNLMHRVFQQHLTPNPSPQEMGGNDEENARHYIHLNDFWLPENLCFKMGELIKKDSKQNEPHAPSSIFNYQFPTLNAQFSTPHITRNSAYFTVEGSRGAQIDKGRLLHDIFRNIVTTANLEYCLNAMITEGKLPEAERTHIVEMVHRALDNPVVSRWFTPEVQVKTEMEILLPDGSIARPDRIVFDNEQIQVIDYKFGEHESEKHRQQVLHYTDLLCRMGYTSVKGFLWYVMLNKVEEVRE